MWSLPGWTTLIPLFTLRVYAHVIRSAEAAAADTFADADKSPGGARVSKSVSTVPMGGLSEVAPSTP